MLILIQYQAHPPQLGLLVVSGLRRLAHFNLSIGPLRTKLFNNMANENGCQGDEKALLVTTGLIQTLMIVLNSKV